MTDETLDAVVFNNKSYALVQEQPGLFSPWEYGIFPENICTSNGRGYVAYFEIVGNQLQLSDLSVAQTKPRQATEAVDNNLAETNKFFSAKGFLPLLNGVAATPAGAGYWLYNDVALPMDYSGVLTLNDLQDQLPYYLELHFKNGQLSGNQKTEKPDALFPFLHQ